MIKNFRRNWATPLGLFTLGFISVLFGLFQLTFLSLGETATSREIVEPHYFLMPIPILVHIVAGSVFNLTSPFQFAPIVRQNWPRLHRIIGRVLLVCGFLIGVSGIWMNLFYPDYGGMAKYTGIFTMSILMIVAMPIAVQFARKGNISKHKLWMKIAIATALSPATQRIVLIPTFLIFGEEVMTHALIGGAIWAGLIINLSVVFWTERKHFL